MRILTFTSLFPDSTRPNFGVFIYQRMLHVARRPGNTVQVVAPVPYVPGWVPGEKAREYRAVPRQEEFGGLTVYHPRYPFLPYASLPMIGAPLHGLLMFIGAIGVARRFAKQGVDCIDAHFVYPDGFAAVLLGKVLKLPVVVSARGTDINLTPKVASVRPLLKWTLREAQGLIGVCGALSDAMVDLGADRAHVRTIGNGVDAGRFHPTDRASARQTLGIPSDRQVIVAVGALIPRKGYHVLIPAMAMLKESGLQARLYIIGEGPYRPALERQIHDLGLEQDVILKGAIANDQLRSWYSAADVSCLASSREGWANVLLESMACGTPVVATRIWGTPEVVVSDDLGLLVEQNPQALADGLRSALQKSWNGARISAFAQQRSWVVVAEEVEAWLAQRTGGTPAGMVHHEGAGVRA